MSIFCCIFALAFGSNHQYLIDPSKYRACDGGVLGDYCVVIA